MAQTKQELPSDVVGVIATFLPPTTHHQQRLMLVNHTWFRGVVQQDGMKPMPDVNWPLLAFTERQPRKLKQVRSRDGDENVNCLQPLLQLSEIGEEFVESLHLNMSKYNWGDEELKVLSRFKCLKQLKLFGDIETHSPSDEHFEMLGAPGQELPQLTHLELTYHSRFSDIGLCHLSNNLPNLTHFVVSDEGDAEVTDVGIQSLVSNLKHLQVLDFPSMPSVTNVGVESLSSLPNLQSLNIMSRAVTDDAMQHIAAMETLTEFQCYSLGNEGLAHLTKKRGAPFSTLGLGRNFSEGQLQQFTGVTELILSSANLCRRLGRSLSHLHMLTKLDISRCPLRHGSLKGIESCQRLEEFSAFSCEKLGDLDMECLCECKNITDLTICGWTNLTDEGLQRVGNLSKLEDLRLWDLQHVTSAAFSTLVKLRNLWNFSADDICGLTNDSLEHICKTPNLRRLRVDSKGITDAGLFNVGANLSKSLEALALRDNEHITNLGLAHLSSLSELTSLDFSQLPNVTDDGVVHLVQQHLHGLTHLYVYGCKGITKNGVMRLKDVSPSAQNENRIDRCPVDITYYRGCGFDDDDEDEED